MPGFNILTQRYGVSDFTPEQLAGDDYETFTMGVNQAAGLLTAWGSQMARRMGIDPLQTRLDTLNHEFRRVADEQFKELSPTRRADIGAPLGSGSSIIGQLWSKALATMPSMLATAAATVGGTVAAGPVGGVAGLVGTGAALTGGETVENVLAGIDAIPGLSVEQQNAMRDEAFKTGADLWATLAGGAVNVLGPEAALLAPVRRLIGQAGGFGSRTAASVAGSTAGESVEGAIPAITTNLAAENLPEGVVPKQDVGASMVEEGIIGGVMGIPGGVLTRNEAIPTTTTPPPPPPPPAVAPPPPAGTTTPPARTTTARKPPKPPTTATNPNVTIVPPNTPNPAQQQALTGQTAPTTQQQPPPPPPPPPPPTQQQAPPPAPPVVQPTGGVVAPSTATTGAPAGGTTPAPSPPAGGVTPDELAAPIEGTPLPGADEIAGGLPAETAPLPGETAAGPPAQAVPPVETAVVPLTAPVVEEAIPTAIPPTADNVTTGVTFPEDTAQTPVQEAIPEGEPPVQAPVVTQRAPRARSPRVAPVTLPAEKNVTAEDLVNPLAAAEPAPAPAAEVVAATTPVAETPFVDPEAVRGPRVFEDQPTPLTETLTQEYEQRRARDAEVADTRAQKQFRQQLKDEGHYLAGSRMGADELAKRVEQDPQLAKDILEDETKAMNAERNDYNDPAAFVQRLDGILERAKQQDIFIPNKVSENLPDHIMWLADVKATAAKIKRNPEKAQEAIASFAVGEIDALSGSFENMRAGHGAVSSGRSGGVGVSPAAVETAAGKVVTEEQAEQEEIAGQIEQEEGAARTAETLTEAHREEAQDIEVAQAPSRQGMRVTGQGQRRPRQPVKRVEITAEATAAAKAALETAARRGASRHTPATQATPKAAAAAIETSLKRTEAEAKKREETAAKAAKTKDENKLNTETVKEEDNVTTAVTLNDEVQETPQAPPTPKFHAFDRGLPRDPYAEARQDENNRVLAHQAGAVNFYGNWVQPIVETTLGKFIDGILSNPKNETLKGSVWFQDLVTKLMEVAGKTNGDMPVYLLNAEDMVTATGQSAQSTTKMGGFYQPYHPTNPGNRDFMAINGLVSADINTLRMMFAHEGIHGVMGETLANWPWLARKFENLLKHIKLTRSVEPLYTGSSREGNKYYGLTDIDELFAEMANEDFAELLHTTTIPRGLARDLGLEGWRKATAWNGIIAAIRRALDRVFGFTPPFTALEAVLSTFERISQGRDPMALEAYDKRMTTSGTARGDREYLTAEKKFQQERFEQEALARYRQMTTNLPTVTAAPVPKAKLINTQINTASTLSTINALRSSATYAPGILQRMFLKLRSLDSLMRSYEHLFPTDSLRRFVNAIAKRYTQAQAMNAEDAKVMTERNNLFVDYENTKIGNYSAQDHYENLIHDMSNWNVDVRIPLNQNRWIDGRNRKHGPIVRQYARLKADYDALIKHAPKLAKFMDKEFAFYKDKHQRIIDGVLTNVVLEAAENKGNTLTPAAALALGRRIVGKTMQAGDTAIVGKKAAARIQKTRDFKSQKGPYIPQKRYGDYLIKAVVDVANPTTGNFNVTQNDDQGYTVVFAGKRAEADAMRFASQYMNGKIREEYAEVESIWTDKNGNETYVDPQGVTQYYTKQDIQAEERFRVNVQNEHVEFFASQREADEVSARLSKDKYYKKVSPANLHQADPGAGQALAGSHQLAAIAASLENRDALKGLPPAQRLAISAALHEAVYRAAPGTSMSKHRIQRRHVAGASKDSQRIMHSYSTQANNYIAATENAHELHQAWEVIDKAASIRYDKTTITARAVADEINGRRNKQSGMHSDSNAVVNALTSWQFIDKLASPAYSLIGASQMPMITLPKLAETHGLFKSSRALTKAMKDIGFATILKTGAKEMGRAGLETFRKRLENAASYHEFVTSGNLSPAVKTMLDKLVDYGSLDPDSGFEATKSQNKLALLTNVENVFRQFPRAIEAMNRYASAVAAFELAKAKGASDAKATEYARDIVEQTQFNYNPANSSPIFNTAFGRIALQFMKYGFNFYQLLGSQVANAWKGGAHGERAQALKGMAYLIGAHSLMSGMLGGLPTEPIRFVVTLLNLFGVPVSWELSEAWVRDVAADMIGPYWAEVVTRGLPRMIGMDVSNRISMSQLLLAQPYGGLNDEKSVGNYFWNLAAGPSGGLATELPSGISALTNGDVMGAAQELIPIKIFSDALKAIDIGIYGKKTEARDVVFSYSLLEGLTKTFGIRPGREAELTEARSTAFARINQASEARSSMMRSYWDAVQAGKGEQFKFGPRFQAYNKGLPYDQQLNFSKANQYVREKQKAAASAKKGIPETPANRLILEAIEETYTAQ